MYKKELDAIKKSNRFRERIIYDEFLIDLASNDYLGLSENSDLLDKAYKRVKNYQYHSPRASQLVNGYHPLHKLLEDYLSSLNDFESAIIVGSGFLANLSLIESLPRKKDLLILDEFYHASGVLASKLVDVKVEFFKHNSSKDLEIILKNSQNYNRLIVGVEGIYSMDADILNRDIFDLCDNYNAILIVDEAHSAGVIGDRFLGVFDYYNIIPKSNHIKMGTLGKALGSYGSYILANREIISFLENRAKAIIYATAPSVFESALSYESMKYIQKNKLFLASKRDLVQKMVYDIFNIKIDGLIVMIEIGDSLKVLSLRDFAIKEGFLVGAIRPPTVKKAILRIIPRLNIDIDVLENFFLKLKDRIKSV